MDRYTDANQFYNLSHAICHSYVADKNELTGSTWLLSWLTIVSQQNFQLLHKVLIFTNHLIP